ncbi:PspA/IM30 family protein [Streptomyces rubiginosohelvolus]|uniref:PspA/IM30 family protein n=1 Tax=Streptomyces rubiginosohelvolus TaxID=67362 RepID=UPI0034240DD2
MQPLYAVDFDVSSTRGASFDVLGQLREHLASWLNSVPSGGPTAADLVVTGEALLAAKPPGREQRQVHWWVEAGDVAQALRVRLSHPIDSGARFVTQVTLAKVSDQVSLRVMMGQEIPSGWLAPIQDPSLYRPNVLGRVCGDEALSLRTLSQVVTGRFEPIRQSEEVSVLAESLAAPTRLPALVIQPRDESAWQLARRASSQLAGLAQVVTLNYATSRALSRELPELQVPDGGALLVWPDLRLSHPRYSRPEIAVEGMVEHWMRTLAELSVLARGSDRGWDAARQSARATAARRAVAQVEEARRLGDAAAERAALEQRVRELEESVTDWEGLAISEAARADEHVAKAADAAKFEEDATRWRKLYEQERVSIGAPSAPADPWASIPDLQKGVSAPTYRALEAASEGRIVFTPNGERSWKSDQYRFHEEMTEQLILLAKAAADLYEQPQPSMPRLDEWFSTQHGLRVATSDLTIKKDPKMRWASYGGKQHDTLPHVKVRDGVSHSDCGRIHFALDPENRRFIVDHVGVKKY